MWGTNGYGQDGGLVAMSRSFGSGGSAVAEEEAEEAGTLFLRDCGSGVLRGEALLGVEGCLDAGIEAERVWRLRSTDCDRLP